MSGGWIKYDSNNSGGSWWLRDQDWKALEEAGWKVGWLMVTTRLLEGKPYVTSSPFRNYADTREEAFASPPEVGSLRWPEGEYRNDETVVATASTFAEAVKLREKYGDYMGALACSAVKEGDNAEELVAEFEAVANQNASDEGCNCCGSPHSFEWHAADGTTKRSSTVVTKTETVWS